MPFEVDKAVEVVEHWVTHTCLDSSGSFSGLAKNGEINWRGDPNDKHCRSCGEKLPRTVDEITGGQ